MLMLKISKYISVLLISLVATTAYSQTPKNDITEEAKAELYKAQAAKARAEANKEKGEV